MQYIILFISLFPLFLFGSHKIVIIKKISNEIPCDVSHEDLFAIHKKSKNNKDDVYLLPQEVLTNIKNECYPEILDEDFHKIKLISNPDQKEIKELPKKDEHILSNTDDDKVLYCSNKTNPHLPLVEIGMLKNFQKNIFMLNHSHKMTSYDTKSSHLHYRYQDSFKKSEHVYLISREARKELITYCHHEFPNDQFEVVVKSLKAKKKVWSAVYKEKNNLFLRITNDPQVQFNQYSFDKKAYQSLIFPFAIGELVGHRISHHTYYEYKKLTRFKIRMSSGDEEIFTIIRGPKNEDENRNEKGWFFLVGKQDVFIVFKGATDLSDIGKILDHRYAGATYIEQKSTMINNQLHAILSSFNRPVTLWVTGHSLGGSLAQAYFTHNLERKLRELSALENLGHEREEGESSYPDFLHVNNFIITTWNSTGVSVKESLRANKLSFKLAKLGVDIKARFAIQAGDFIQQTGSATIFTTKIKGKKKMAQLTKLLGSVDLGLLKICLYPEGFWERFLIAYNPIKIVKNLSISHTNFLNLYQHPERFYFDEFELVWNKENDLNHPLNNQKEINAELKNKINILNSKIFRNIVQRTGEELFNHVIMP